MSMQAKLITFDVFSALVDYRASLLPVVATIPGLASDDSDRFLELWRTRQLAVAAISNSLQRGRISFHDCTGLALDYGLRHFDLSVDATMRNDLIRAWYALAPWPEADQVLAACRENGCRLAILSNGDQGMLEALAGGFQTSFDDIFSSEHCGVYKPHPDMYAMPVRALGVEDYLHVAGSPNDAIGAGAAGVTCYWSNRQGDQVLLPEFAPDHQGPDLRGVLQIL
jgi:2-haloacid dehalogenase